MSRRHLFLALLLACLGGAIVVVGATQSGTAQGGTAQPAGPRLALSVSRGSATGDELVTIGPEGEAPQRVYLIGGPDLSHPNWNADGTELAFYGPGDETPAVFVVRADGSGARILKSSEHPGGPDDASLSEPLFDRKTGAVIVAVADTPEGEGLFGDNNTTRAPGKIRIEFWELPTDGAKERRLSSRTLSRKRPFIPFPTSISDDGKIAASAVTRRGFAVVTMDPRRWRVHTVVPTTTQPEGSVEPTISPDGTEIVYKVDKFASGFPEGLISTDLMIVPAAGGKPRLLARVPGGARWPSWDPSGSRIAFTALNAAGQIDYPGAQVGSSVMEMNPDGSCLTKVYSVPGGSVSGAAWQPGTDRGVGPLSC
jgi:Tol biopolymer transport system component